MVVGSGSNEQRPAPAVAWLQAEVGVAAAIRPEAHWQQGSLWLVYLQSGLSQECR